MLIVDFIELSTGQAIITQGKFLDHLAGSYKTRTYALTRNTKYVGFKKHIYRRGLALLNPYGAA
jgi:hypothetical protein